MKKGIIIIAIIIIAIATISYIYLVNEANYKIAQKENQPFEGYEQKEIYGTDLATLINKAIDNNKKNEISLNDKGKYQEDNTKCVRIDIQFTDDDSIHSMEEIDTKGTDTFMSYYNQIKFKCIKTEYHFNHRVKYLLFEQITN